MRLTLIARSITASLVLAILSFYPTLSSAATAGESQRYEQALAAVLADPGNPQKSFELVQAAVSVGDMRGAVTSLERMLLIDPTLANIRLELGVLYQRLGNQQLARYHLQDALRATNMPNSVRTRAERHLAATGTAVGRNFFSAQVGLGYRYESNANAAPDSPFVSVTDAFTGRVVIGQLSDEALERSDSVLEGWARLNHSWLFANASGSAWDSELTLFGSKYDKLDDLNQLGLRLETGPGFVFGASSNAFSRVRPFATVGKYRLDGHDYIDAAGGGAEWVRQSQSGAVTALRVQYLDQDFENLPGRFLEDRSGGYLSEELSHTWQLGRTQLGVLLLGEQADADADYQAYDRYGGGVNLRVFLGRGGTARWTAFASGIVREARYDAADPLVDPGTRRKDTRTDANVGVEIALGARLALLVQAGYIQNDSNLPNFEYQDTTGTLNFVFGF